MLIAKCLKTLTPTSHTKMSAGRCFRQLKQQARRGTVAPIRETPFSAGVCLDDVETGQAPRHSHHQLSSDALGLPAGDHLTAPRVIPGRGGEGDAGAEGA